MAVAGRRAARFRGSEIVIVVDGGLVCEVYTRRRQRVLVLDHDADAREQWRVTGWRSRNLRGPLSCEGCGAVWPRAWLRGADGEVRARCPACGARCVGRRSVRARR